MFVCRFVHCFKLAFDTTGCISSSQMCNISKQMCKLQIEMNGKL